MLKNSVIFKKKLRGAILKDIGKTLKALRENAGLTCREVAGKLIEYGFEISDKTIYGYESGRSSANADMFLALCRVYKCNDILNTFGDISDSILFTNKEWELVESYRALDPPGQSHVDSVLQWETERIQQFKQATSAPAATRMINYYYRLASAGTGQIIFDMPPTKRIEIPAIPEYRKADYAIGVNGTSMEPVYHDGDTLLVEMTDSVEIGEIGIFLVNGESFVKKRGEVELISLNRESKNIPLNEDARCLGKVIGKLPNN